MGVKKIVYGMAVIVALGATGTAFAQRHPPARGGHETAVPRGRVVRPGGVRIRPHAYIYRRDLDHPRYYQPAFRFGLYVGSPYGLYGYPYSYSYGSPYGSPYPYTYTYSYGYPYAYTSPYGYQDPYAGAVAIDPTPTPVPEYQTAPPVQPAPTERGTIAIEGAPAGATISVDGYYAGAASDFTSRQPLSEVAGYHRIEIQAPGRRPVVIHVDIQPGRMLTYHYPTDNPLP
ncbi:MAG TPA: PEGA domain-containing protein [Vicinamibacterales bacterium]|nr:PEGA domain-containing protein [Vicinamibacterales bacterium]